MSKAGPAQSMSSEMTQECPWDVCASVLYTAKMFCFLQLVMGTRKQNTALMATEALVAIKTCIHSDAGENTWIKDTSHLESHSEKKGKRNLHFVPLLQYVNEKRNLWIPSCCQIPGLTWAFWDRKEMGHRANPWLLHCHTTRLTAKARGWLDMKTQSCSVIWSQDNRLHILFGHVFHKVWRHY